MALGFTATRSPGLTLVTSAPTRLICRRFVA
jgi:hypothetical protein